MAVQFGDYFGFSDFVFPSDFEIRSSNSAMGFGLPGQVAPVDHQRCSRDVAGGVAGEEQDGTDQFFRFAPTSQGCAAGKLLFLGVGEHFCGQVGQKGTGAMQFTVTLKGPRSSASLRARPISALRGRIDMRPSLLTKPAIELMCTMRPQRLLHARRQGLVSAITEFRFSSMMASQSSSLTLSTGPTCCCRRCDQDVDLAHASERRVPTLSSNRAAQVGDKVAALRPVPARIASSGLQLILVAAEMTTSRRLRQAAAMALPNPCAPVPGLPCR